MAKENIDSINETQLNNSENIYDIQKYNLNTYTNTDNFNLNSNSNSTDSFRLVDNYIAAANCLTIEINENNTNNSNDVRMQITENRFDTISLSIAQQNGEYIPQDQSDEKLEADGSNQHVDETVNTEQAVTNPTAIVVDAQESQTANDNTNTNSCPPKKEFKLRIVPLERLLEKRLQPIASIDDNVSINDSNEYNKQLNEEIFLPVFNNFAAVTNNNNNNNNTTQSKEPPPVICIELSESDEDTPTSTTSVVVTNNQENNRSKRKNQKNNTRAKETSRVRKLRSSPRLLLPQQGLSLRIRRCLVKLRRINWLLHTNSSSPDTEETAESLSDIKESLATIKNTNIKARQKAAFKMNGSSSASVGNLKEEPSTSTGRRSLKSSSNSSSSLDDNDERDDTDSKSNEGEENENADQVNGDDNDDNDNAEADADEANSVSSSERDSSDSEIIPSRKKRVLRKDSNASDSDFVPNHREKRKRRRIKAANSSDDSGDDDKAANNKRKHIRKIMKTSDLNITTKTATKEEEERRKRIEERQKLYNKIYEKPDNVEVNELVLDFDAETKKSILEVDQGLMKKLKPHQVAGVKFMWDACYETIKDAQEKPGSGCILAHCMGLGKTLQIVTLCHTLLVNSSKTKVERALVITPLSTLNNWAREFKHWISFTRKRNIEIYDMSKYKDKQTRIFKLNEWFEEGGVCILGYDMYRILANEKAKGLRKKQRESLQRSLVDPGADLVICDEGHLLKNEKTSISKAVTRMRTKRRIVLTGTPLQNNLKEYYCMIQFIKPNLLGTYKEYLNRFVNPISNGQYTDSTERDIRLMKHRSHILHKLLEGCIQRRDYSVLAPYLSPKHEYVVYTMLSILQQQLYEHYMTQQRDITTSDMGGKGARLFQDFQELRRIWTHPMNMRINSDSVIRKKIINNDTDSMDDFICDNDEDDEDEASASDTSIDSSKSFGSAPEENAVPGKVIKTRNFRKSAASAGEDKDSDLEELGEPTPADEDPSEWWKRFVADKELNNINHSPKLVILMHLLQQCESIGDKVLVFSQSLQSLDTIEHFLSLIDSKTRGYEYEGDVGDFKGFWTVGADYFRLDGSCSVEQRESMCKKFNDVSNLRARLFLISTRAGGLGINLVSANRVVIFDVSWNPSHDTQSIFRVYRFGQEKPCYIYRLIAMGTMEQKLYERQVAKQATAKRVIDEQQISRHYNQSDLLELYTYELQPSAEREIPILPKDRLFAELLSEHDDILFKYHEHDSLLENEESENLSEAERKAAWSEYEAEKTRTVQTAQYVAYDRSVYGGQYGNAAGSVTSNKIFGFRTDVLLQLLNMKVTKDHPELTQAQVVQLVPSYLQKFCNEMNNGDPTMYKDLYNLHSTLIHPSGMYMNPLLYVNQNPMAAGYFQAPGGAQQPPINGMVNPMPGAAAPVPVPVPQQPTGAPNLPASTNQTAPGFDPNQVYEID